MQNETRIYEEGLEEHPVARVFLGNLLMILWIALGTIACWFLYPPAAWIYTFFAVVMLLAMVKLPIGAKSIDSWIIIILIWGVLVILSFGIKRYFDNKNKDNISTNVE